jgi:hypothetical protein
MVQPQVCGSQHDAAAAEAAGGWQVQVEGTGQDSIFTFVMMNVG